MRIIIKRCLFILLVALPIYSVLTGNSCLYAQDKIVAIVNDDCITQRELNDFNNFMRLQLSQQYQGEKLEEKLQSMKLELLDKLIEDRLILQEAKKDKIKADESRIKGKLNEVKMRYPSEMEFQRDLGKQGLVPADLESRIREQLLMYLELNEKVRSKIIVRPEEVTSFYEKHKAEIASPEEREIAVIALDNKDMADAVSYNLRIGQKTEDLATRYPMTINQIKAIKGQDLRKEIEEVVFKLGINEVSSPVKMDDKFYVFKLDNITAAKQLSLADAQDRINQSIFEQKMNEKTKNWLDELKKNSYIKIFQD
ncbi:MAG: peptidyl-prolyl cis-trans isomerase [Candidatus Omnitrophica bacterium]|nr:peptidyl-prolyl cis-trans isomerase [Candidatus Omnitrophota bacterium]